MKFSSRNIGGGEWIRGVILVPLAGLALVAVILALRDNSESEEDTSSTTRNSKTRFYLPDGEAKAYQWSLTTTVGSGGNNTSELETVFDGTLNIRLFVNGEQVAMAVQIMPLQVRLMGENNKLMESAFSTPFVIHLDALGQFGASLFPQDISRNDRAALDATIRSLQIVLPKQNATQWTTIEMDQNGEFRALYQWKKRRMLVKRKQQYLTSQKTGIYAIRVLLSDVRATVDTDGLWLERSEGKEIIQLEAPGGKVLARVDSRFKLEPLTKSPDNKLGIWNPDLFKSAVFELDSPDAQTESTWDIAARELERQRFVKAGITLKHLVAELSNRDLEEAAFARQFASFLRIFPDEVSQLSITLRAIDDRRAALLMNILELAGTPQAQATLIEIAESEEFLRSNRLRALVALSGVEAPTTDTVAGISRLYESQGPNTESAELSSTALLTLGTIADKADDVIREEIH